VLRVPADVHKVGAGGQADQDPAGVPVHDLLADLLTTTTGQDA
jgi:hypothetical protein